MIKYIITNGHSVVNYFLEDSIQTAVEVTTKEELSIKYDSIGEAMHCTSKVNAILGGSNYYIIPIEI